MTRVTIDPHEPDPATVAAVVDLLREGGIVAYPTDTLYGLAVDPRNDDAVKRLFEVKGRDPRAPVALTAADVAQAQKVGAFGTQEMTLARAFWPGPLTIVVSLSDRELSRSLTGDLASIGVRVPAHAVARAIASAFGGCITATSANLSGEPPAMTPDEVASTLARRIDALVDAGPVPGGPPSTVVEFDDGRPVLRRRGAIAWERVLKSLE